MTTDRERAIAAIRRGVPLGTVVKCACHTDPPTRRGCFGVCEDAVAAIIASYEAIRAEQRKAPDDADPPTKWLVGRLRDLARELVADPKTPWIGERDPEKHICWTAADRIEAEQP